MEEGSAGNTCLVHPSMCLAHEKHVKQEADYVVEESRIFQCENLKYFINLVGDLVGSLNLSCANDTLDMWTLCTGSYIINSFCCFDKRLQR